jgi:hypothetical protein
MTGDTERFTSAATRMSPDAACTTTDATRTLESEHMTSDQPGTPAEHPTNDNERMTEDATS